MSQASTFVGRRKENHHCTLVNEAFGVDICAESSFCIDVENIPSRCIDLNFKTSCFIGKEKNT
jgi:hypothetical protein